MNDSGREFLERYGDASFPRRDELIPAIESNSFFKIIRPGGTQPCSELAQIYRDRAMPLNVDGTHPHKEGWEEFTLMADTLSESPDEVCHLWLFRGEAVCFSVFEMIDSRRIAGCLKFAGVSPAEYEGTQPA